MIKFYYARKSFRELSIPYEVSFDSIRHRVIQGTPVFKDATCRIITDKEFKKLKFKGRIRNFRKSGNPTRKIFYIQIDLNPKNKNP
ncbi:transposase [Weissella oryzae SG25]|uniref:Transposase n=1 Tax=Weissella oryzae (strain DSM 25784 / JCM 18191 / LMG 30913 / SG25) TaxID=1329250 RepID=A0A069CWG7_WEIOS|nr:transposase [Weissella oryzae SG25]